MIEYRFLIQAITYSILSFLIALSVWLAGSHYAGALSTIWQYIDLKFLLLMSISFMLIGGNCLIKSYKRNRIVVNIIPTAIWLANTIQLCTICSLVILKVIYGVD